MAYTLGNALIYTGNSLINNGYVTVDNGKIAKVGYMDDFNGSLNKDLKGMLLMPAWVNAHTHIYSTLARGMKVDFHPLTFTQILEQLWWKLDKALGPEEIQISAMAAAAEFIHNGVATIFDHHSSPLYVMGSLEVIKRAVVDTAGMRGVFCFETSDRDGIQLKAINENHDFYSKYKGNHLASGMMGLHASFTLSDETLEATSKACEGQIPIHVHVAEGLEDEMDSINSHGLKIIERFDRYELLNRNSIYAHCIHTSDDEVKKISGSNGFIVMNVQSNMNNSVGIPKLSTFVKNRAKVAFGNDGFGFSPAFDIRLLSLSQKYLNGTPLAFSNSDLKGVVDGTYELASKHLKEKFGRIEESYSADMMVIDYFPPTPITFDNFYDHLFFGITESKVNSLYVNGKGVMVDGRIETFDESEVKMESKKVAQKLWEKL